MRVLILSAGLLLFNALNIFSQIPVKSDSITGEVYRYKNFPSQLTDARNVDIWLPPDYETDKNKNYPVVYMHDGQNLFDLPDSARGTEWGIDETMTKLIAQGKIRPAIIVGIWNTPRRAIEFMPQKAFDIANGRKLKSTAEINKSSAESDKYLKFIVTELKPFIDKNYRTKADRQNTFIMGSSMGALMSLYAIGEYPDVFGGAACLSPQYPLAKGVILDYLKKFLPSPENHKIYFDYGTRGLDAQYAPYQKRADALLRKNGYTRDKNWITLRFPGAGHTEKSWGRRVSIPLTFLLGK